MLEVAVFCKKDCRNIMSLRWVVAGTVGVCRDPCLPPLVCDGGTGDDVSLDSVGILGEEAMGTSYATMRCTISCVCPG